MSICPDDNFVQNLRHIEKAIYAAEIPHVVPQKVDSRSLKIPLPKYALFCSLFYVQALTFVVPYRPTVDARNELVKSAAKLAEDTRVQLRRHEQTSVKKMKYEKHSVEIEQVSATRFFFRAENLMRHPSSTICCRVESKMLIKFL